MTITEFLLARITEDEAVARSATPGRWTWQPKSSARWPEGDESLLALSDEWRPCDGPGCAWKHDGIFTRAGGGPYAHEHRVAETVLLGWGYDASGIEGSDEDRAHIARHDPARVLAECEAKRRIVELHKAWPVLVTRQPTFEPPGPADVSAMTFRMSQQIAWATEQEYRERFGDEPPTAPMLRALAAIYADHPDYDPEWTPRA